MKYALLALLLVAFNASATNPPNDCGNRGNNCQPGDSGGNSSSDSSSSAGAVGVGVGVGTGGDGGNATATASGGAGGDGGNGYGGNAVGLGGSGGHSSSTVKDSGNSFNVNTAKGGSAHQGQSQGQSLNSANLLRMTSENKVNASSANDNRSSANGNTTVTNVGGDSTLVERNAPPVFLGNLSATMSCSGGFNAGASDRNGSGAFGFTWISGDCRSVVIGREFVGIGMPDVACRVWKTTNGYKRAVKADPSLSDVDCTAKPAPAPVPVLVAPELAPRIPRG
jgi:hypothetical protein